MCVFVRACVCMCVCVCGGALYGLSYVFCFCSHQTPLDISVEAGHFDVSEMILRHRVGVSYTSISLSYSPPMGQTVSLTQAVGVFDTIVLVFHCSATCYAVCVLKLLRLLDCFAEVLQVLCCLCLEQTCIPLLL